MAAGSVRFAERDVTRGAYVSGYGGGNVSVRRRVWDVWARRCAVRAWPMKPAAPVMRMDILGGWVGEWLWEPLDSSGFAEGRSGHYIIITTQLCPHVCTVHTYYDNCPKKSKCRDLHTSTSAHTYIAPTPHLRRSYIDVGSVHTSPFRESTPRTQAPGEQYPAGRIDLT